MAVPRPVVRLGRVELLRERRIGHLATEGHHARPIGVGCHQRVPERFPRSFLSPDSHGRAASTAELQVGPPATIVRAPRYEQ